MGNQQQTVDSNQPIFIQRLTSYVEQLQSLGSISMQDGVTYVQDWGQPKGNPPQNKKKGNKNKLIRQTTPINLNDLQLNQTKQDCELEVMVVLPPFQMSNSNNDIEKVASYNYPCQNNEQTYIRQIGRVLKIRDPYYKVALDQQLLIRVDEPQTITVLGLDYELYLKRMINAMGLIASRDQQLAKKILYFIERVKPIQQQDKLQSLFKQVISMVEQPPAINYEIQQQNPVQQIQATNQQFQQQNPVLNSKPKWKETHQQMPKEDEEMDQNQIVEIQELMMKNPVILMQLQQTMNLALTQNYKKLIEVYQNMLRAAPNYAFLNYNLGENAYMDDNYELCVTAMKKFLEIHNKKQFKPSKIFHFAHYQIGSSLHELEKCKEAEIYFKKAVNFEPTNQVFLGALGYFYFERQDFTQAEDYLLKGAKYGKTNDFDSRIETCRIYYNLICLGVKQKRIGQIVEYACKTVRLDDTSYDYIKAHLENLIVDPSILNFEERFQLCQMLRQTPEYGVITEEWILLLIYYEETLENKRKAYNSFNDQFTVEDVEAKEYTKSEETFSEIQTNKLNQESKEGEKPQPPLIQSGTDDWLDQSDITIKNQQAIDDINQRVAEVLLPENLPEVGQDKERQAQHIKKKYKSKNPLEKMSLKENMQQNQQLKKQYPGFLGVVEYFKQQYLVVIDRKLKLEDKYYILFKQAALKGFVNKKYGASGIKKIDNLYEIKVKQIESRLVCEKEGKIKESLDLLLNFNKLMNHKQVKKAVQK